MKHKILFLLALLLWLPTTTWADEFVNLTPRPKSITMGSGVLTLPDHFTLSHTGLTADMVTEVQRFAQALHQATGYTVEVRENDPSALFQFTQGASSLKEGGYVARIQSSEVSIESREVLGTYYACQTLKKMMPACVMAGVKDDKVTSFTLPCATINDEPRFTYRGFMLDVSRHFFTIDEVKRMLDVMAYYKLNRFHWHLSDDQGWRAEIKKYPRLTTVGATAPNCRFTDMDQCTQYWINKPYGPYFYTQEEMRDVVAYAKERHIEVIPEIDMPGHFCAALAAYPEFSCSPYAAHSVQTDGGIYSDVMNVANPKAVQFTQDILEELMDIFPSEYIHIGGDECPTSAWEGNAQCQALYKELGLSSYRALQTHFINQMSDFVKSKGRKLAVWNEAITAGGADLDIMKATNATVFCWTGAENAVAQASKLGMPRIYTPWGPYYINRRQGSSAQDPPGAGDGSDNVQKTYNTVPPTATDLGVQGTFWTEHVSDAAYMEWLALPRLLAIAEAGWTPQSRKDFADFQKRMAADTTLLNYGGYRYCKYLMPETSTPSEPSIVLPKVNTEDHKYYYRIVSGATDNTRKNRCIELLTASSPLVSQYATNGAQANVLWTNVQAAEGESNYDAQWWSLEESTGQPGHYALVCKSSPEGSVNPSPTQTSNAGRWTYDASAKHYAFVLGSAAYGTKGSNYYYSIMSSSLEGKYLNSSMAGQGLAVNVYANPADGAGGQWEFQPAEDYGQTPDAPFTENPMLLEEGHTYVFTNAVEGFDGTMLADTHSKDTQLHHSTDAFSANAWTVTSSTKNADGTQTVKLKNATTGRFMASTSNYVDRLGFPMGIGSTAGELTVKYVADHQDYRLMANGGRSLFAMPSGLVYAGSTISGASYDAPRQQGAEWMMQEVRLVSISCTDTEGQELCTFMRAVPSDLTVLPAALCPQVKNCSVKEVSMLSETEAQVTYERTAFSVTYKCTDSHGAIVSLTEVTIPVGQAHEVSFPTLPYFTFESASAQVGEQIQQDDTVRAVYSTDALIGVKQAAGVVTSLEPDHSYLLYDASSDAARVGYRRILPDTKQVNRSFSAEGLDPSAVWTLEASGKSFKVKNEYFGLYIPALQRSAATTAAKTGSNFTFTLNSDGQTWNVKGTNGMYWDGIADGSLVGWDGGTGHPIRVHEFIAQPYFTLSVKCVDESGKVLSEESSLCMAGDAATLTVPTLDGYKLKNVEGNEGFQGVADKHYEVTATFTLIKDGIDAVKTDSDACQSGIYDLQGRRLNAVKHAGVYVIHGRKVIVK